MESASSWPREPGSAADGGCVSAAAPRSCNCFRNPLTHLPSGSRICTEISVLPVSLKTAFASLLGSKTLCCKYLLTSSAQVFAGAWLQLENPSVVNASPAAGARARHTPGSAWLTSGMAFHRRAPAAPACNPLLRAPGTSLCPQPRAQASAPSHPSPWASSYQILASPTPARPRRPLGWQLSLASPGLAERR